jgi:hypothetical protein
MSGSGGKRSFAARCTRVRIADFPDIRFCSFADAAFVRSFMGVQMAVQHISPKLSFRQFDLD